MRKRTKNKYLPNISGESVFFSLPSTKKQRYVIHIAKLKPEALIAWDLKNTQWCHVSVDESIELIFWTLEKYLPRGATI